MIAIIAPTGQDALHHASKLGYLPGMWQWCRNAEVLRKANFDDIVLHPEWQKGLTSSEALQIQKVLDEKLG